MSRIKAEKVNAKPGSDKLHVNFSKPANASGILTVHQFMDHDHFIAYIPSLNLSAYGTSEKEAMSRLLNEVFDDFMSNLVELGSDDAVGYLAKLGWSRNKVFKKRFMSNSYIDRSGVLKNFNLPEETPVNTAVIAV